MCLQSMLYTVARYPWWQQKLGFLYSSSQRVPALERNGACETRGLDADEVDGR